MKNTKNILISIAAILGISGLYLILKKKSNQSAKGWAKVVNPPTIRDDNGGSGQYKSSRTNEKGTHEGVDLVVKVGQNVYAPIDGVIVREAKPYPGDSRYSGLLLKGNNGEEIKIFYVYCDKIGQVVNRGERIATAQSISKRYNSGVTDHIHIELRIDGVLTDPTNLLTK